MNILKAALLEEFVRRVSQVIADAHDSRNQLCAASQVSLRAKKFVGVTLRRQRILVCRRVTHELALVDCLRADLQLEGLTLSRTTDQLARGRVAGTNLCDL